MPNRFYKLLTVLLALALSTSFLFARNKQEVVEMKLGKPTARPIEEFKVHNVGKVWTATSNYGNYGDPNVPAGLPSYEWPGGSGTHYNWEGRFWIGAEVDGEKRVSHADFGNYEFKPSDGSTFFMGSGKSVEDSYVIFDDFQADLHDTDPIGVKVYQRGLTWSTPDYDDFVIYEYEVVKEFGGSPYGDVLNNVVVSWVFDCDVGTGTDPTSANIDDLVDFDGWDGSNPPSQITYTEDIVENVDWDEDGIMLGYDDLGIPYGWRNVGSPTYDQPNYDKTLIHPDGFYDCYTVVLDENGPPIRWQTSITTTIAGVEISTVAGEIAVINGNTLYGYVVPRNMSYMYDGDDPSTPEEDTNERGKVPGFIGGRLIYTDFFKKFGAYNQTADDSMMRVYSHQWWNWESDPGSDRDKYDYAMGTNVSSMNNMFMPHPFDIGAPTFDYRFMLTTGPYPEILVGDTLRFVYAAIVGLGMQGLRQYADNALEAYYAGSKGNPYNPTGPFEDDHYLLPVPPPVPVLKYSPVDRGVKLAWDNSAETAADPLIGVPDFEGYRVYRAEYRPQNWTMVAAFDNVSGPIYLLDFETGDTLVDENGDKIYKDLPDLVHSFIDTGGVFKDADGNPLFSVDRPVNNLPYYYVVTAYDNPSVHGRPEFPQIESAKVNFMVDPATGAPFGVMPRRVYSKDQEVEKLNVKVYPNPYKGGSPLEVQYEDKVSFTNLPPACKITILTLYGDIIDVIYHTDGTSDEAWDLVSRNEQDVVSGMYIFIVEVPGNKKQVGKFVILRGE